MRNDSSKRVALRDKLRGQNALPVRELISRADAAVKPLYAQYGSFAAGQISHIEQLLARLEKGAKAPGWETLVSAIHDLRSSSAIFGAKTLSECAAAWERTLAPQFLGRKRIFSAMRLHLELIKLALQKDLSPRAEAVNGGLTKTHTAP